MNYCKFNVGNYTMKKTTIFIIIILFFLPTAGCELFVAGTVTGAGVFSYIDGELKRSYQADFNRAVTACKDALTANNLTIKEEILIAIKGIAAVKYRTPFSCANVNKIINNNETIKGKRLYQFLCLT